MIRLLNVWDTLRESFWFLPALLTALAIGLALALLAVDRRLDDGLANSAWLYSGGAEGARSLLSAVAGSIITVVALAFSITIVSLQLAAAQLGPRLLRNFVRDRGNQMVLGVLVATFAYCLVVLRTVRGRDGLTEGTFVPHVAITGAVVLALVSVALLIYFIHHASRSIQADRVIAAVGRDLERAIDDLLPERAGQEQTDGDGSGPSGDEAGAPVAASGSGYITSIDHPALLRLGRDRDLVLHLVRRPGDFVIEGEPLVRVVPAERLDHALTRAIARDFVLNVERTMLQDLLFGVQQLVEIAVRALASGYADPTTALRCIDRLGAVVARVSLRRSPPTRMLDGAGAVRLVVERPVTVAEITAAAFTLIRFQGAGNLAVALHLLQTLERLATLHARRDLHVALLEEAVQVHRAAAQAMRDPGDRAAVRAAFGRVFRALRTDVRRNYDATAA